MAEWSEAPPLNQYHPSLSLYIRRAIINLERIDGLLFAYQQTPQNVPRLDRVDILRASVVFLHATLEDILRSIAVLLLPLASPEALDQIPFGDSRQREKFLLGALSRFRGKTVDEVLQERVWKHYQQVSFNSTREIAGLLSRLKIDVQPFEKFFPILKDMIERRHRIVHRADLDETDVAGAEAESAINPPLDLDAQTVVKWQCAMHDFSVALLQTISTNLSAAESAG
jgi:hypothetical protein